MRLFIAIDFKEQEGYLKSLQEQLPSDDIVKIKKVKKFHLTLKFLGEVEEDQVEEIKERLSKIKFKPFTTTLTGLGFFPDKKYVKVIWIGCTPTEPLIALEEQIMSQIHDLFMRNDFKFLPHLTLARVTFIKEEKKFFEQVEALKTKKVDLHIDQFKLIKSTLTDKGPIYEDLAFFFAR